ncbi:MAG: dockerin type I domain-containing protein [archaeon]
MKKRRVFFLFGLILFFSLLSNVSSLLLVNHTAVDDFDAGNIPSYWIDQVKQSNMVIHLPGQSHAQQFTGDKDGEPPNSCLLPEGYGGLEQLEILYPEYSVQVDCSLSNLNEANALHVVKGQYTGSSWGGAWECRYGDEEYWSREAGRVITENTFAQAINQGKPIDYSTWGWSYDIINDLASIDEDGNIITFNDERMDAYFNAFVRFNTNPSFPDTIVYYMTAITDEPIYNDPNYVGYKGWRVTKYNQDIRNEAIANDGILFDQADIENWNEDNTEQRIDTWDDGGTIRTLYLMHEDFDISECGHVSNELTVKKAKAVWWMAARLAGWNGDPSHTGPTQKSLDVNSDGLINTIDLALITYWQGTLTSIGDFHNHLDLNSDGIINWNDVTEVLSTI